jgi:branched-chain amino acid transport system permease protein
MGVAIDRIIYFPLRQNKASNLVFLITSFGLYTLLQNLIQLIYGAQIFTIQVASVVEGHKLLGAIITDTQILILVTTSLLSIILVLFIHKTKLGKAMRAVADDQIAASVVGINPEQVILTAFAIGSTLAGAAGILISLETNIEPSMGLSAILKGIIASIVGGIGSIPGAMLGGLFLGFAENFSLYKIDPGWKDSVAFAVLIIFLLIKPSGILGTKVDKERL